MDVVVTDILARFGKLHFRSRDSKLGWFLKLDFTYAIIPIFGGEERILYEESRFAKIIIKEGSSSNSTVYN